MNSKLAAVGEEAVVICYGIHHGLRVEKSFVRRRDGQGQKQDTRYCLLG
jgi:hypothetical protein